MEFEPKASAPPQRRPRRRTRCMFQDKKGRWWLDYYTPEGRRRRKVYSSFDDAEAALAEIKLAKKRDTYFDPNNSPSFSDYAKKYLENVSAHKESPEREQRLMKHLTEYFGASRLSKLKRPRVIEYRKFRLKTVGPSTVNREIALLRHMLNVAIDEGLLAVNPARGGPGLKAFKETRRTRYLEMAEIDALLAAIQARIAKNSDSQKKASAKKFSQYLQTAVVVALHTGMRKSEILGLRWRQINWEKRNICLGDSDTKNGTGRRVPIDTILMHALAEHHQRIENQELVFPSYDSDGKVVPLADVKVSFGMALTDANIENFRFHDLRHTFASHYMMSGGNLYTLAKILGHKDIKMTQRYADLSPDFIDRERDRMDTIWTPTENQSAEGAPQTTTKYVQ